METLDNAEVVREIEKMAARKRLSMAALLRGVDLDAGLFHKWKRGEVRPTRDRLARIRERARQIKRS
jgi:hypothetical protein